MSSESVSARSSGGIGLGGAMFLVFLVLKLGVGDTDVQHWSWWLVTLPLWAPLVVIVPLNLLSAILKGGRR